MGWWAKRQKKKEQDEMKEILESIDKGGMEPREVFGQRFDISKMIGGRMKPVVSNIDASEVPDFKVYIETYLMEGRDMEIIPVASNHVQVRIGDIMYDLFDEGSIGVRSNALRIQVKPLVGHVLKVSYDKETAKRNLTTAIDIRIEKK